jgi:UDP-N-acetylglucosamine/UDP-N-acetylgalactosamine diphosphorylase
LTIPENLEPIPSRQLVGSNTGPALGAIGRRLLAEGAVAVLTLAGGRSTRLGGRFRGDIPIGPVSARTLWDLHGERIAAIRARYAPTLCWLVLTSPFVHDQVVRAMDRRGWFGLPRSEVRLFQQEALPVLDAELRPARHPDGQLIHCPGGHGGVLAALREHDVLSWLARRSVQHLFVFQYPNVLEHICDPVLVGVHHDGRHDVTLKAAEPAVAGEKVGRVGQSAGRAVVVEYHTVQAAGAEKQLAEYPIVTGTAMWSVSLLGQVLRGNLALPYRVVPHHEPDLDRSLWRLEQWTSDLLSYADSIGCVLASRADEYAPIKYPTGRDSVPRARRALTEVYRRWLDAAGAGGPDRPSRLEISPGYALCAAELAKRLPAGFRYTDGLLLED